MTSMYTRSLNDWNGRTVLILIPPPVNDNDKIQTRKQNRRTKIYHIAVAVVASVIEIQFEQVGRGRQDRQKLDSSGFVS